MWDPTERGIVLRANEILLITLIGQNTNRDVVTLNDSQFLTEYILALLKPTHRGGISVLGCIYLGTETNSFVRMWRVEILLSLTLHNDRLVRIYAFITLRLQVI